jgi:hypothetical protein
MVTHTDAGDQPSAFSDLASGRELPDGLSSVGDWLTSTDREFCPLNVYANIHNLL